MAEIAPGPGEKEMAQDAAKKASQVGKDISQSAREESRNNTLYFPSNAARGAPLLRLLPLPLRARACPDAGCPAREAPLPWRPELPSLRGLAPARAPPSPAPLPERRAGLARRGRSSSRSRT